MAEKHDQNPILDFIEERCAIGNENMAPVNGLYMEYLEYVGHRGLSKIRFGKQMAAQGFSQRVVKWQGEPTRVWVGVGLRTGSRELA